MIKLSMRALSILFIGLLGVIAQPALAERITFVHTDTLGSPVAATDSSGSLLWQEDYRPYGERRLREAGDEVAVWFTGKPEESDVGLQYFGARWYDPNSGRFISPDPVGFVEVNSMSFNRYIYANDNPYKFVDPDGRFVLYAGLSGSGNAGIGASAASGIWFNFTLKGIEFGFYGSTQGGAEVKVPGAGVGVEGGFHNTDNWRAAMEGAYNATGVELDAGVGATFEKTTTLPSTLDSSAIHGGQITIELSTPSVGAHSHFGVGWAEKMHGIEYQDIADDIIDRLSADEKVEQ